jgi:hypothetical protein
VLTASLTLLMVWRQEVSVANRNDATPCGSFSGPIFRRPDFAGFIFMQFTNKDRVEMHLGISTLRRISATRSSAKAYPMNRFLLHICVYLP